MIVRWLQSGEACGHVMVVWVCFPSATMEIVTKPCMCMCRAVVLANISKMFVNEGENVCEARCGIWLRQGNMVGYTPLSAEEWSDGRRQLLPWDTIPGGRRKIQRSRCAHVGMEV
ncbi:spotted leaf 11 [Musa troglodytarum]|uniref:Spotted leaf 11 n=1 Tax=Musa troglodytarum TaxID=320322 RepID=A0A9E7K2D1_9LILI|nr:spotted leaf 11 [Musa troglodytarum]